jgi:hypothetical protein
MLRLYAQHPGQWIAQWSDRKPQTIVAYPAVDSDWVARLESRPTDVRPEESSAVVLIHRNRLPSRLAVDSGRARQWRFFYLEVRVIALAPGLSGQEAQAMST